MVGTADGAVQGEYCMDAPVMEPDDLGDDWVSRPLPLLPDEEGEARATLVHRRKTGGPGPAILYVHGFCDYFFQDHLARRMEALGHTFYALDLRKYGRSLRPHQTPNFCTDLSVYDEELDAALRIIREENGHRRVVVMSHSTGGLTTALWAHRRRGRSLIDAMVMNSPWFDLAGSAFLRGPVTAALDLVGAVAPRPPLRPQHPPLGNGDLGLQPRLETHRRLSRSGRLVPGHPPRPCSAGARARHRRPCPGLLFRSQRPQ